MSVYQAVIVLYVSCMLDIRSKKGKGDCESEYDHSAQLSTMPLSQTSEVESAISVL